MERVVQTFSYVLRGVVYLGNVVMFVTFATLVLKLWFRAFFELSFTAHVCYSGSTDIYIIITKIKRTGLHLYGYVLAKHFLLNEVKQKYGYGV